MRRVTKSWFTFFQYLFVSFKTDKNMSHRINFLTLIFVRYKMLCILCIKLGSLHTVRFILIK